MKPGGFKLNMGRILKHALKPLFSLHRVQGLKPGAFQALWVKLDSSCTAPHHGVGDGLLPSVAAQVDPYEKQRFETSLSLDRFNGWVSRHKLRVNWMQLV
jgi:hypothetical protein